MKANFGASPPQSLSAGLGAAPPPAVPPPGYGAPPPPSVPPPAGWLGTPPATPTHVQITPPDKMGMWLNQDGTPALKPPGNGPAPGVNWNIPAASIYHGNQLQAQAPLNMQAAAPGQTPFGFAPGAGSFNANYMGYGQQPAQLPMPPQSAAKPYMPNVGQAWAGGQAPGVQLSPMQAALQGFPSGVLGGLNSSAMGRR